MTVTWNPLNILILCGGQSSRMGSPKALLTIDNETIVHKIIRQVSDLSIPIYISCREDQRYQFSDSTIIQDNNKSEGPMTGIRSAFAFKPNASWILLTCDMPNVDNNLIQKLIVHRSPKQFEIIGFQSNAARDFETFPSLWEGPPLYDRILLYDRPGAVMRQAQKKLITEQRSDAFININTPEEWQNYLQKDR